MIFVEQVPGLNVTSGPGDATEVLCLMNMVTPDELEDEEEYEGTELCSKSQSFTHSCKLLLLYFVSNERYK